VAHQKQAPGFAEEYELDRLVVADINKKEKENSMLKRLLKGFGLLATFVVIAATLTMFFNGRGAAQQGTPENVVAGVFTFNPLQVALLQWYPANLTTSFAVGVGPSEMAFDGANIWVGNVNGNSVTKLRASDGAVLGTFAVGAYPYDVAFDGTNIWVTNFMSNNVTKLRASDGAALGTFTVGNGPYGLAFDGAHIWVANSGGNNVTKLRAHDGTVLGTFAVGSYPRGVAFDGANIWVANHNSNTVSKL
jgi:outer membrane protein assembly factor BamB